MINRLIVHKNIIPIKERIEKIKSTIFLDHDKWNLTTTYLILLFLRRKIAYDEDQI